MVGLRFGPYEVTGRLGSGGMGEVYRARDARLGRDVAIKVLPAAVAADPDRLARFDREARALAALSHPHIGAIFGLEEAGAQRGLVLELIEGPTLADRVASTSHAGLPAAEAIEIAAQIADALEAAHTRGIVHRDLKPANIKIADGGVVKLLDFGLAKTDSAMTADDATRTSHETGSGVVLGTPRYMSPEQVRGHGVGTQADIWAFGCVLFEMLTGRPAFDGATAADIMAAVLDLEPDWSRLPDGTVPVVRHLLRRCLRKDLRERLRHIGDARIDLDDAQRASGDAAATPAVVASVDFRRLTDSPGLKEHPALSPDGKMIAFTTGVGGTRQIWIQLVAGGAPLQLTRDRLDHDEPRWSPDGSRLIFHVPPKTAGETGSIWEMAALGGAPRRLVAASSNGDISPDGTRLAYFRRIDERVELVVMMRDGSGDRVVATVPAGVFSYQSPRWSPDGHSIAFMRTGFARFEAELFVVAAASGEPGLLVRADWIRGHAWRPDGSGLVYSASTGSTMPYPPTLNVRSVDRDGRHDRLLTFGDASYQEPDVRAPGHLVAARARTRSDVWLFPVDGAPAENVRAATRLTRQTGQVQTPSFSPDGTEFVYVSDHGGHSNLWIAAVDGSSVRQITYERDPDTVIGVAQWSPRGDQIVFIAATRGRIGLHLVTSDGGERRPLVAEGFAAHWSSDGRWVYCMDGSRVISKIDVDTGERIHVRAGGAPTIGRDGRVLYFIEAAVPRGLAPYAAWHVWRAEPEDGPATVVGTIDGARPPFSPRFIPHLDLSPDGEWLACPLTDGAATNIWLFPTRGGPPHAATDFGDRATLIVRWVSWAPDGRSIAAAVAETDIDIVWLGGLV